jgi:hypothetical protein
VADDRAFCHLVLELVARLEDSHAVVLDGSATVTWPETVVYADDWTGGDGGPAGEAFFGAVTVPPPVPGLPQAEIAKATRAKAMIVTMPLVRCMSGL